MAAEGFLFMSLGERTKKNFSNTCSLSTDGMNRGGRLIESMSTKDMNPKISDSLHAQRMLGTGEKSQSCSKSLMTYDIAYAGPRNRYTVATDAGPLIVHNCGYGLGAKKFQMALKASAGIDLPDEEAAKIISTYRESNAAITALWKAAGRCLDAMIEKKYSPIGVRPDAIYMVEDGFQLPSGYVLGYKDLRCSAEGEYSYATRNGRTKIYGGKIVENCTQALARCVIAEQMVMIADRYRPVLTVHDAIAIVAPEAEAERAQKYVEKCMRTPPNWAAGLPLNCESGIGATYAAC